MPTKRTASQNPNMCLKRTGVALLFLTLTLALGCGGDDGGTSGAVTRTVIPAGGGDFQDIQSCIDASSSGDTCLVSPGTYGPIRFFGKGIRVVSTNGSGVTVLDGKDEDTVVRFVDRESGASILEGFTIQNGHAQPDLGSVASPILTLQDKATPGQEHGGGIKIWIASPVIQNCIVRQNHAQGNGGGVYCAFTGSRPTFRHVVFQENTAEGMGGAMAVFSALPDLENCLFFANQAENGGAVSGTFGADVLFSNCTVADNGAASASGADALYLLNASASLSGSILWGSYWIESEMTFSGRLAVLDLDSEQEGATKLFVERADLEGRVEQGVVSTATCLENSGRCSVSDDPLPILIPENPGDDPDPLFVELSQQNGKQSFEDLRNAYFLEQEEAGEQDNSPCLDTGGQSAVRAGLDDRTTQNGENGFQNPDTGTVDLGYHYPITLP